MPIDSKHKKDSLREILKTALRATTLSGAADILSPMPYGAGIPGG